MKNANNQKAIDETAAPSAIQNFLRRPKVCEITGLKTSTLYELMKKLEFPRPIRISARLVVWVERDVAAWQAERMAQRQPLKDKKGG